MAASRKTKTGPRETLNRLSENWAGSLDLKDEAATLALGALMARALRQGDVILLSGPLGAGKTALARAVIRSLTNGQELVPSPTFTLVQTYETPGLLVTHADLYRIAMREELRELALDEAWEEGTLLVEWPGRAPDYWPASALEIELEPASQPGARTAHLRGAKAWQARLNAVGLKVA